MDLHAPPRSLSGLDCRDIVEVLAHAGRWTDTLRGARILVTGATGWFGTWLLDALVALDRTHLLGLRIVAVSRDPAAFAARHPALHRAPQIDWIKADVRWPFSVGVAITHVIHAATDASAKLNVEDPDRMRETIVAGTRNVLEVAAAQSGVRVLLVSSGAVYGMQPATLARLPDDHVARAADLDTGNAYAEGKREAERLVLAWSARTGNAATIARCFAFVGPHMPFDAHFAIGNFIRDALERDAIVIKGDGAPLRSYLYMSDLVIWLLAILVDGRSGSAYNVGSDEAVSIVALARHCAASTARSVEVVVENKTGAARNYVPAVERARSELALDVRVPLAAAISRTVAWRSQQVPLETTP